MDQWIGCNAIVTGASSGIGAAIAKKFVETGINVIGVGRRAEKLEEVTNNMNVDAAKFYPKLYDLSDKQQISDLFAFAETEVGPISILVNNAAIFNGSTNISDGDVSILRETIATNSMAVCICTREAIKSMKANKIDGIIMHISSIAGHYVPDVPAQKYRANVYPVSKHGLTVLYDTLRTELRREKSKIRVSLISPGVTLTDVFRNHPPEDFSVMPYLVSEDVADSVMYVLSTPPNVQVEEIILRPVGEYI